jgi:hypothetical protein
MSVRAAVRAREQIVTGFSQTRSTAGAGLALKAQDPCSSQAVRV